MGSAAFTLGLNHSYDFQILLNDFEEARQAYAKAIALDPSDPELLYAAAVANWSMANREITAEKAAGRGIRLFADLVGRLFRCAG